MKLLKLDIEGLLVLEPKCFEDHRGYFLESFNSKTFKDTTGLDIEFVQDNESKSQKNVLRGFHFQSNPVPQSKLVRAVEGSILDVALDLRLDSPTFGKCSSVILDSRVKNQFFIPHGFAHAFLVLSNYAIVSYKVDNFYNPDLDSGIKFDDKEINFDWGINTSNLKISEKDLNLQSFSQFKNNL